MARKKKKESIELVEEETDDLAEKDKVYRQKEVLTLFLFLMPLLLIAYSSEFVVKIGLFFYEAVLLRNYIMDQYRKKEL